MIPFRTSQANGTGWMFVILAVATLTAGAVHAQQVGTAAAVNPAAQARSANGSRTVVIGQAIAHRERIQTASAGSVQLLFLDKTSMTIGPNSDLSIDEYVYDPATNSGKLAATLSKGVMRFVGGQISHAGNAQITTPNAVVGIRGGVAILQPSSVYVGYGEGNVQSGSTNLTLSAGEFTQTFGTGQPPTSPGPPPANFLQSVLANLQSQGGQGGGARASGGQVNQARTNATGSTGGSIATNVQNLVTQPFSATTQNNAASNLTQTIQTTATQSTIQVESVEPESLTGFTAGVNRVSQANNNQNPAQNVLLFGTAEFKTDPARNRAQANFEFGNNKLQFGSVDPNLPASSTIITQFDDLVGVAQLLLPAVNANGTPISGTNGVPFTQQQGGLFQLKPGAAFTQAAQQVLGGTPFCECEFTRWGFWGGDFIHGPGNIKQSIDAFWVAGRQPDAGSVPGQGIATYVGHVAAQIANNGAEYAATGKFVNTVNFGTQTGNFAVTNLDLTNYQGSIVFLPGDPRKFAGFGQGTHERFIVLGGSFFRNSSSQVGEMGGGVLLTGSNYLGGGIFIAKK
jgi:hypothetical protein